VSVAYLEVYILYLKTPTILHMPVALLNLPFTLLPSRIAYIYTHCRAVVSATITLATRAIWSRRHCGDNSERSLIPVALPNLPFTLLPSRIAYPHPLSGSPMQNHFHFPDSLRIPETTGLLRNKYTFIVRGVFSTLSILI